LTQLNAKQITITADMVTSSHTCIYYKRMTEHWILLL